METRMKVWQNERFMIVIWNLHYRQSRLDGAKQKFSLV